MRHVLCVVGHAAGRRTTALAPPPGASCVGDAPAPRALVALRRQALCGLTCRAPTRLSAVAVAAIAVAAQHDLGAASRAQVQAGGLVHAHPGTTEVLDGLVPARHTAVAPPSLARCRARYGHQASRRVRPLPCPPSSASSALYRGVPTAPSGGTDDVTAGITTTALPPAPAWPPCRAARLAHTPRSKPGRSSSRCSAASDIEQNRHLTGE